MESVAVSVVDLLLLRLHDFLTSKQRLDKLSNEVEGLKLEQQRMQSSLRDADARRYKNDEIQKCLGIFRSLSYIIQDLLESYDMEVERREGEGIRKFLAIIRRVIEDPFALKNLKREIIKIKLENRNFTERYHQLKAHDLENEDNQRLIRSSTVLPRADFVGMKKDMNFLLSLMVDENRKCPFIFICGMFGTGKTALARELYHHPVARGHFEGFAWIDLSKTVERRSILQDILRQLLSKGIKKETMEMEDIEFTQLYHVQQERKCLVVLDGIGSFDAWEVVKVAFSSAGKTSKILLTTRMREIAETMAGNGHIHTMSCLIEEEGWELLKRKAFPRAAQDDLEDHGMMEKIGKDIARRCRGLPLAIAIIGGFMAIRPSVQRWKELYHNMDSVLEAEESQILASAFNDLPNHIKPCFLYLSYFPEEYNIEVEKLYLFWIAEDMIASEDRYSRKQEIQENRMEIAEEYLKELQLRSLVEVEQGEVPTFIRFKSCRLNGFMRELCLLKGKEEEFVKVIDFRGGNQDEGDSISFDRSGSVRRLIVYLGENIRSFPRSFMHETAKYLRCLLIYMDANPQGSVFPQDLSKLGRFTVLRVLDFNGVDFHGTKLPGGISKLKRLRYLSFQGCQLEALPKNIGTLPYLQVLDLRVSNKMMIPNILWKLKRLRHLYFPKAFRTSTPGKLQLGSLKELETLKNLNTNLCNVEDLLELTKLRYLSSVTKGSVTELEWIIKRMSMVTNEVLYCSIDVGDFDCYTEERHSVFRQLLVGRALHSFSIKGYLGEMPSYHAISQRLAEIVLSGSELKEDAILALEKLSSLRVLVLDEDAFIGAEMLCYEGGFRELRRFQLSNLRELKKLTIANEAFPKLSAFAIQNCAALKSKKMPSRVAALLPRRDGE